MLRRRAPWVGLLASVLTACGSDGTANAGRASAEELLDEREADSGSSGAANAAPDGRVRPAPDVDSGLPALEPESPPTSTAEMKSWWQPTPGATWQWQLSEPVAAPLEVAVYDVDWETDPVDVQRLHAAGIFVICYVSVGSWEDWRPDADDFPPNVIGAAYEGWPGENYLDIRSPEVRALMELRFDACRDSGFDAIEPDNMDVYELGAASGYELTRQDGIDYALWLADRAHERGLGIGQKNAPDITEAIQSAYDWALTESCFSDGDWCGEVEAYVANDRPVFMCEYEEGSFAAACDRWRPRGFSPILKGLDLDAPVTFCD